LSSTVTTKNARYQGVTDTRTDGQRNNYDGYSTLKNVTKIECSIKYLDTPKQRQKVQNMNGNP